MHTKPTKPTKPPVKAEPTASVSDAEAHVMQLLWQHSPLASEDIALALQPQLGWQLATVKTLLSRLLAKGAVQASKEGRRFLYSPVLQRQAWLATQSTGLVDRWFGGQLAPLVAHFAAHRPLQAADVAALKRLLKDAEKG
jgi:BlaI family transcriptional regulator, penicillinase repressor